jgi:hypothetical protein
MWSGEGKMSSGSFTKDGKSVEFGFLNIADWFDSVIVSFPAPWIIGDDTHYGTEIFDSRGVKVMSVWMAWGNPSERQRDGMSASDWLEYCCDSHWESETQWHIANAIVTTRNYLKAHEERGWYGDNDQQREILRNLVMTYGRWKEGADTEIACGGPDRRITSAEAEKYLPDLRSSYGDESRQKERLKILEKLKLVKPTAGNNPDAAESQNRHRALILAIARMMEEHPPTELVLNGLKVHNFTLMDKPYLERMAELAEEEYDRIKKAAEPTGNTPEKT